MATLKDIAKKTGVSITAVSLILNGRECRLSENTKKLVTDTARQMNYRPNRLALGLITKKTNTIGLIIPDISNMFFGELAKGVEDEAQMRGYNVIFCNTNDNAQKDSEYVNVLTDRGVDGIIISVSSHGTDGDRKKLVTALKEKNMPVVMVDRQYDGINSISVLLNYKLGAYLAMKHLIELGHKKIGCITGPLSIISAKERFEGYKDILKEAGIKYDNSIVYEGDYHTESGFSGAEKLIKRGVTAVFACNDMMAYGVYKYLKQSRLKIPDDISVVGFDDIQFSELLDVPLTTVHQPVYKMGREACLRLIESLNGNVVNNSITFEPALIIRQSTGQNRK